MLVRSFLQSAGREEHPMNSTVTASAESVVWASGSIEDVTRRLEAALYAHSTFQYVTEHCAKRFFIVTTKSERLVSDDERRIARSVGRHLIDEAVNHARNLAEYQCGRLQSCGFYAAPLGDRDECYEYIGKEIA
jgi:hypothetical protein